MRWRRVYVTSNCVAIGFIYVARIPYLVMGWVSACVQIVMSFSIKLPVHPSWAPEFAMFAHIVNVRTVFRKSVTGILKREWHGWTDFGVYAHFISGHETNTWGGVQCCNFPERRPRKAKAQEVGTRPVLLLRWPSSVTSNEQLGQRVWSPLLVAH